MSFDKIAALGAAGDLLTRAPRLNISETASADPVRLANGLPNMKMRTARVPGPLATLALLSAALFPADVAAQAGADVRGAWNAERYLLADGDEYEVRGNIFFAEREWQVLFFVIDDEGQPRRGSGEGGTYARSADGVVFRHLFNLSVGDELPGLPEAPLRMVARGPEDAPLEPTRVDVVGDVLTLHFPSGNRMVFRKTPRER